MQIQLQQQFHELINSDLDDTLKLQEYYRITDALNDLKNQNPTDLSIPQLLDQIINNPMVSDFMFRITDEESYSIQEVKSLTLINKPSIVGRSLLKSKQQDLYQNEALFQQEYIQQPQQQQQQYQQQYNSRQQQEQKQKQEYEYEQQPQNLPCQFIPIDELSDLINKSKYEFDQTKLDEAYKLAQEAFLKYPDLGQYTDYVNDIKTQYEYMIKNLTELESDGWSSDGVKDGISIKYKFPSGTNTASMLMETNIPVNAIRVLALVNEVDLNYLWVPFCKRTYVNKVLSRACKVCTSEMYFPLIPNRECVFVGEGYDRLKENGTIVLLSRSVDQDHEFLNKNGVVISQNSKFIRMNIHYYIFEIKPKDQNTCSIRAITNVDPHISMVPNSVLAYIGRKFAHILVAKIVHFAKNFEQSPFYPIYEQHKEFYDWLQGKMSDFLGS